MGIGRCFNKLGNLEVAEKTYENAIAHNTEKNFKCFYKLGCIYFKMNKLKQAVDNLLKALSLNSTNFKILIKLGQIYLEMEGLEENYLDESFYYLS